MRSKELQHLETEKEELYELRGPVREFIKHHPENQFAQQFFNEINDQITVLKFECDEIYKRDYR
jgi:hypothetical protein